MKFLQKQGLVLAMFFVFSLYGVGDYGDGLYGKRGSTAPACTDTVGVVAPWLYGAIPQSSNSILLYFTDASDPVDTYALEFGTSSGDYKFAADNIGPKGMSTYLAASLAPNTKYYFRVRGGNGCATGSWSNEISAKTKGLLGTKQLDIVGVELEPSGSAPGEEAREVEEVLGYTVNVRVVNEAREPLGGASVAIYPNTLGEITDENGRVRFGNLEAGEYTIVVSHDGYEGEQVVYLAGENRVINIEIVVKKSEVLISPVVGVIALAAGALILVVLYLRRRRIS